jgi:adenylosuccinate lyase
MPAWRGEGNFLDNLKADAEVAKLLKPTAIEALFDEAHHTKHVDAIFRRVFGSS